jgi:hypothetical protein
MAKSQSNISRDPLRWSIFKACKEFRCDKSTLAGKLTASGIKAGEDGFYSTHEIYSALSGNSSSDIKAERLRECRERADNMELRNMKLRGELLPTAEVHQALAQAYLDIKSEILGYSDLSDEQKDSLLGRLSELEISGKTAKKLAES